MIRLHFKITWPLLVALAIGLLVWIIRNPGQSQRQPAKHEQPPTSPRARHTTPPRRPIQTIIMPDRDGSADVHDDEQITFTDALRSGRFTAEQLAVIGNREAAQRGHETYDQVGADSRDQLNQHLARLRTRRSHHA